MRRSLSLTLFAISLISFTLPALAKSDKSKGSCTAWQDECSKAKNPKSCFPARCGKWGEYDYSQIDIHEGELYEKPKTAKKGEEWKDSDKSKGSCSAWQDECKSASDPKACFPGRCGKWGEYDYSEIDIHEGELYEKPKAANKGKCEDVNEQYAVCNGVTYERVKGGSIQAVSHALRKKAAPSSGSSETQATEKKNTKSAH